MAQPIDPNVKVKAQVAPVRRIITGHNSQNQSIVVSDEECPHVIVPNPAVPTFAGIELWTSLAVPDNNALEGDQTVRPRGAQPPEGGVVFRILEIPPDKTYRVNDGGLILSMHRTRSVDFVIVLSGEVVCVLDKGEVAMRTGDTMVQRGTNHDWQNRSDQPVRIAFIMLDALPLPGLDKTA